MRLPIRITLYFAAFALLFGLISLPVTAYLTAEGLRAEQTRWAQGLAEALADSLAGDVINADPVDARDQLARLVGRNDQLAYALLVGFDGEVFSHTFDQALPTGLLAVARAPLATTPQHVLLGTHDVLDMASPLVKGRQARLHIGIDQTHNRATVVHLTATMAALLGTLSLLGALVAYLLGRRLSRPMESIAAQMAAFGRGERVHLSPAKAGTLEESQMLAAFGAMVREREHHEAEHGPRQELWRTILDSVPEWLFLKDDQARYLMVNRSMAEFFGRTPEELIGLRYGEIAFDDPQAIAASDASDRMVLDTGKAVVVPEIEVKTAQGDYNYRHVAKMPWLGADGRVIGIVGVTRDITERKRAEQALRESDQRLHQFMDASTNFFVMFDANLNVLDLDIKAARSMGLSTPKDAIGINIEQMSPKIRESGRLEMYQEVLRTGQPLELEDEIVRPDGSTVWLQLKAFRVGAGLGNISADITERKLAEQAIVESERRLSQAQRVAHVGAWEWDLASRTMSLSDEAYRIFGWDPERTKPTLEAITEAVHPEDRDLVLRERQRRDSGEAATIYDYRIMRPDGEIRYVEFHSESAFAADGTVLSRAGAVLDITERKLAEQELATSKRLLQTVFDTIPQWVLVKDRENRILMANKAISEDFGVSPKDLVGKNANDLDAVPENIRALWNDTDNRVIDTRENVFLDDYSVLLPSGKLRLGSLFKSPLLNDAGAVVGVVGISEDNTERKLAEQAVVDSERRLLQAQTIAHMGAWERDIATGELRWSDQVFHILGMEVSESAPTLEAYLEAIHPDDRMRVWEKQQRVDDSATLPVEFRIVRPDGEVRYVESHAQVLSAADGTPLKRAGALLDITARKLAEQAVLKSERLLSHAQALANVGAWEWDLRTNEMYWSDETLRIFGWTDNPLNFDNVLALVHPDDRETMLEAQRSSAAGEPSRPFQYRIVRPDGEVRHVEAHAETILGNDGTPLRRIGAALDITERKRAEQAVVDSERRLSRAQSIAHVGAWEWEAAGGHLNWADELYRIYGWDPEQTVLSTEAILEAVHPADRDHVARERQRVFDGDTPRPYEYRIVRPDGAIRNVEIHTEAVFAADGTLLSRAGAVLDITERRTAELEMRASEERFRAIAAATPYGLCIVNKASGELLYFNEAYRDLFALGAAGPYPPVSAFYADPGQRATVLAELEASGRLVGWEMPFIDRTGREFWSLFSCQSMEFEGQQAVLAGIIDMSERRAAEEEARVASARLHEAIEAMTEGFMLFDEDEKLVLANSRYKQRTYPEISHQLVPGIAFEAWARIVAQSGNVPAAVGQEEAWVAARLLEFRNPPGPSDYRLSNDRWLQIIDHKMPTGGTVSLRVDITERKRIEEEVRSLNASLEERVLERTEELSTERNFISAVLETQEALVVVMDRAGRIVRFNSACEQFTGYTFAEVQGRPVWERLIPPEQVETVQEVFGRLAAGDFPSHYENHWVAKGGARILISWSNSALLDNAGAVEYVVGTGIDITERRRSEQDLLETKERLGHLLATSPAVIYAAPARPGGHPSYVSENVRLLLGYEADEVTADGGFLPSRIHPQDLAQAQERADRLWQEGAQIQEFRLRHKDGNYRWIHDESRLVQGGNGDSGEIIGMWMDVTDRKEAELALERAQMELLRKEKLATLGQLTATVSHELRNPLGTLRTSVFTLQQALTDQPERIQRGLQRMERNILRCDHIITDLLDFSRTRALKLEPTAVDEFVSEVLAEQELPAWLSTEEAWGTGALVQLLDRDHLRRAVINLVDNAVQAMAGGPDDQGAAERERRLKVATRVAGERLEVCISDTGPGIPDDVLGRIFEPLFSTKNFGVGLGLAMVQQIMRQDGGNIEIDSTPGQGTRALLWLPLRATTAAPYATGEAAS